MRSARCIIPTSPREPCPPARRSDAGRRGAAGLSSISCRCIPTAARTTSSTARRPRPESPADVRARRTALQHEAFRTSDDNRLLFYVPGGGFQQFPPGAVKRISAGNVLAWGLHYTPTGKPEKRPPSPRACGLPTPHDARSRDQAHRRSAHHRGPRVRRRARARRTFRRIPPLAADWRITAITPFQDDVTLYGLWPHMHYRGKDMTFIATLPGRPRRGAAARARSTISAGSSSTARHARAPAGGQHDQGDRPLRQLRRATRTTRRPTRRSTGRSRARDEMFNGWMELSVDKHVIARRPSTRSRRPSISASASAIGSGPPGTVYVRDADGSW